MELYGRSELRILLQDIGYFNSQLEGLLHPVDQILSKETLMV
jgi:hypothetical protein